MLRMFSFLSLLLASAVDANPAFNTTAGQCGFPAREIKWKNQRKVMNDVKGVVGSPCECEAICQLEEEYTAWQYKVDAQNGGTCTCITGRFKKGLNVVKAKSVKHKRGGMPHTGEYWTSVSPALGRKPRIESKLYQKLQKIGEVGSAYFYPWTLQIAKSKRNIKNKKVLFTYTTANASMDEPVPVMAGSKFVSAYALLRKMEEVGLNLDERICKHLPTWDCKPLPGGLGPDPSVTFRDLLSFQSGIWSRERENAPPTYNCGDNWNLTANYDDCVEAFLRSPNFDQVPGKFFQYNHANYLLAGMALTGGNASEYEAIFTDALTAAGMDKAYYFRGEAGFDSSPAWKPKPDIMDPSGNLYATPNEMMDFHLQYLNFKLPGLSKAMFQEFHTDHWGATNDAGRMDFIEVGVNDTEHMTFFGRFALGHWIGDCPWTRTHPNGPWAMWSFCKGPRVESHQSMGYFGAISYADSRRGFVTQSVPYADSVQGKLKLPPGHSNMMGMVGSQLIATVSKLLVNAQVADIGMARDPCHHLCLAQDALSVHDMNYLPAWPLQFEGLNDLRNELHEAIECPPCPQNFDPEQDIKWMGRFGKQQSD